MQLLSTPRRFVGPLAVTASLALIGATTAAVEAHREESRGKRIEIAASVWEVRPEDATLVLATFNRSDPVKTTLTEDTRLEGVCVHCQISLQCRAGDLARRCAMCPCERSNMLCLTGKAGSADSWPALLRALPRGTRLRLEYVTPDKPESGIKRLVVDRRGALLAVEGLAEITPGQLQTLGKSMGAARIDRNADGSRLLLGLKDNWTEEKEAHLERALAKLGAKLASPPIDPAALAGTTDRKPATHWAGAHSR